MNETLSTRQLRLVALLGLVVVCAGGYFVLVAGRHSSPSAASSTPAVTAPASTTPAPSKAHSQSSTPAKVATHGLPVPVAKALQKHSVVVVSLYSPHAALDVLASGEAKAGAAAMGAGFVNLDVYSQQNGTAILRKLGVVDTPAVLVIKRPDLIYSEFKGFTDRAVVEQAVAEVRG
jgi:hypothetical protein